MLIDQKTRGEVKTVGSHSMRAGHRGRFLAFVALLMMVVTLGFASTASADPTPSPSSSSSSEPSPSTDPTSNPSEGNAEATSAGSDSQSLYNLSSNVSGYFGNMMAPAGSSNPSDNSSSGSGTAGKVGGKSAECGNSNCWSSILKNPANGGAVVGFTDDNVTPGLKHWWASNNSKSSVTISYDSAKSISGEGISSNEAHGPLNYMYFGAALHGLGFDSVSTDIGNNAMFNKIMGGLIIAGYVGAALVDKLFDVILHILIVLNPFQILFAGVSKINSSWAEGMSHGSGPFSALSSWLGDIFGAIIALQWAVIVPMMLCFLAFMFFMSKRFDHHTAIRKYVLRIIFMTIGIPLVGSMFTGTLNALVGSTSSNGTTTMNSTRMVLSTFVDTRDWALSSRLALPESNSSNCTVDIAWDSQSNTPAPSSQANARSSALCINSNIVKTTMSTTPSGGNPNKSLKMSDFTFGSFSTMVPGRVSTSDGSFGNAGSQNMWNKSMYAPNGADNAISSSSDVIFSTIGLLQSYMGNEHVAASDFETNVKGYLSALALSKNGPQLLPLDATQKDPNANKSSTPNSAIVASWFTSFSDVSSMNTVNANRNLLLNNGTGGLVTTDKPNSRYVHFASPYANTSCGPMVASDYGALDAAADSKNPGPVANCNLSTLSMYNYLNSSFDSSSVTVYSSQTSGSTGSRFTHNAVSAVGVGVSGWLYRADTLITLMLFAYVGFTFGLNMLQTNIRRSWQIVSAAVGASVGILSQAAKLITYSVIIIIEILGTLALFVMFEQFAIIIPDVISSVSTSFMDAIARGTSNNAIGAFSKSIASSGYTVMGVTLISIASKFFLMRSANRHRVQLLDALEAASTNVIERFIDPGSSGSPLSARSSLGSSNMGRGMKGAASGAGSLMNKGLHSASALGHGMFAGHAAGKAMEGHVGRPQGPMGSGSRASLLNGQNNPRTNGLKLAEEGVAGAGLGEMMANNASDTADAASGVDGVDNAVNAAPASFEDGSGGVDGASTDTTMDNSVDATTAGGDAVDMSESAETGGVAPLASDMDDVDKRASEILDRGYLDEGQGSQGQVDGTSSSSDGAGNFNTDADIASGMNETQRPDGSVAVGGEPTSGVDFTGDGAASDSSVGNSDAARVDGTAVDGTSSADTPSSGAGNFNPDADVMGGMNAKTNSDGSVSIGGDSAPSTDAAAVAMSSQNSAVGQDVAQGSNVTGSSKDAAVTGDAALSNVGSAFNAGRHGESFSSAGIEGASNTSVAAADMGQAMTDLRQGRIGEAARDIAAAGSAVLGNDSMSEKALGLNNSNGSGNHGSDFAAAAAAASVLGSGGSHGRGNSSSSVIDSSSNQFGNHSSNGSTGSGSNGSNSSASSAPSRPQAHQSQSAPVHSGTGPAHVPARSVQPQVQAPARSSQSGQKGAQPRTGRTQGQSEARRNVRRSRPTPAQTFDPFASNGKSAQTKPGQGSTSRGKTPGEGSNKSRNV